MGESITDLAAMAVAASLQPADTAANLVRSGGFVQYDPIRHPARAQDLIVAQRVEGYHVGDLDRCYPTAGLEEGHLHVYGVMPRDVLALLFPRCDDQGRPTSPPPTGLTEAVLAAVREHRQLHPRDARSLLGHERIRNAWGGMSAATTRALETLHRQGYVRVAYRDHGTKVYAPADWSAPELPPVERLRRITLVLARLLAPVQQRTLRETLTQLRRRSRGIPHEPSVIDELCQSGALKRHTVDDVVYLWPPATPAARGEPERARFLAPFDPLVWDRRRFAHLWGWPYRLEAYTPIARRQYGYYALAMLWRNRMIGWVNCSIGARGALEATPAYVAGRPWDKAFTAALDTEIENLRDILDEPNTRGPVQRD